VHRTGSPLIRGVLGELVVVAVVGFVGGCGLGGNRPTSPSSATSTPSTSTPVAILDTPAYKLSVSGADRPSSTPPTVAR